MEVLDAVVVGAGPAGTAAAISAARLGLRVVCLDKASFPRDKTCGDGLTANALRLLQGLGWSPGPGSIVPVRETVMVGPNGRRVHLPMPGDGLHGAIVRRHDLDDDLVALARAVGADVREGAAVETLEVDADAVRVNGEISARFVIAADGHWSRVRRLLEPDAPRDLGEWHAARQYFTDVAADRLWAMFDRDLLPGYAWVFPLPGGAANVGYGVLRGDGRAGRDLKALWPDLLARPLMREILGPRAHPSEPVRAWPIPSRYSRARLRHGSRVLFVGDAAGVVDPLTGEGIAQAIETGMLAAHAIATGADYERLVRHALGRDLRLAAFLQNVMSHDRPARAVIRMIDLNAWTRRNFARWLWEDYPRAVLGTPRRWHRGMLTPPGAWRDG